jgi:hypothetical protein
MKFLLSCQIQDMDLVKGLLAEEEIACEVTNDTSAYPAAVFYPELWVVDDSDFARASAVVEKFRKPVPLKSEPWTRSRCGEQLEAQFLSCWQCGTSKSDAV